MTKKQREIFTSVKGEEFYIFRKKGDYSFIRFLKTGYTCRAKNSLIKRGIVYDPTHFIDESDSWETIWEEYKNKKGEVFYAFKRKGKKLKIMFPQGGYVSEVFAENAKKGKVSNPYAVTTYGVGIIGIIDKSIPYWDRARQLWRNMIKRCYYDKDERGYLDKAFVDERWHLFENFLHDIPFLDGFDGWLEGGHGGIPFNLDKDFIMPGNSIYSRHLCCFLPESFNKALGKKNKTEPDWAAE